MRRHPVWVSGALALSLLAPAVAGCAPVSAPTMGEERLVPTKVPEAPAEATSKGISGNAPEAENSEAYNPAAPLPFESSTEMAVGDLVMRLGVETDDVVVMSVKELEISAVDFGCPGAPEVGEALDSAGLVQVQEIVLAIGGQEYVYRAHGWQVVPCRPPVVFADLPAPPQTAEAGAPVSAAKSNLTDHLGVALDQIEVHSVEAVEWPDASLGCPQPGMMYAQVVTPGYRILLASGGASYEYHSDRKRAVLCQPK